MKRCGTAIIGASETTELGKIPEISDFQLYADAALNAMADAEIGPQDIDGVACTEQNPADVAYYLGIKPTWVDSTNVGGSASVAQLRHAAAAIESGLCKTVLITHGESGRSQVGGPHRSLPPSTLAGQFDMPFGLAGAASFFGLPLLRYMHEYDVAEEQLANVAVVQRLWAARNPRAYCKEPISAQDVLDSPMIAYPLRRLMCCLVTDGGGAVIVTSAERARDFPNTPVYLLGSGEATDGYGTGIAHAKDPIRPELIRVCGELAFKNAGISHGDIDHLMIYDAFAHLPLWGLEGLGFVEYGAAAEFIAAGNTSIGGSLPMNTTGGGLSYTHTGHYGMYALLESVRQLRGEAAAQVDGVKTSLVHAFGNLLSACATAILTNQEQ